MRKAFWTLASFFLAAGIIAPAASAHGIQRPCNPYYIMEKCKGNGKRCRAHMHYQPGHSLADSSRGNYFYTKPHRWHFHEDFGHVHKVRYVETERGTRKTIKYKRVCVPHHH